MVEDGASLRHGARWAARCRQPASKVRRGAGATVLGNIEIGAGAVVVAGAVALAPVAPATAVAGVLARPAGAARGRFDALAPAPVPSSTTGR